jgi:phage virion morphogenesis protein
MAGTSISVSVTGDLKRFEDRLQKLVNFDFKGLNTKIGNAVLNNTLERFKQSVDPEGKPWVESGRSTGLANKAGTAKDRRNARSHKTLVDTARLKNSLHVVATPDAAEVGTDVIYARIHQFGGETGRGGATKLPARPYLGFNDEDQKLVATIVEDHIREKAGQ